MLSIERQLARGALVCPKTREELVEKDGVLTTSDGLNSYLIKDGVPILLPVGHRLRRLDSSLWNGENQAWSLHRKEVRPGGKCRGASLRKRYVRTSRDRGGCSAPGR